MGDSGYLERPDYRVDIHARRNRISARLNGQLIAESDRCLMVDEQDHGIVFYFPRDAVDFSHLERNDHHTTCPFKGQASYWNLPGQPDNQVAWSYETPMVEVARLAEHVAFYQDKVDVRVSTPLVHVPSACRI